MASEYWEKIRRQRVTRRRALSAGAMGATGAALAATVGCGDDDDDEAGGATSTAPRGASPPSQFTNARYAKKFVATINDPPITMDFHTQEPPGSHYAAHAAYNGLIYRPEDPPGNFIGLAPELAESWEQPDDTTVVLHIREGVKWHDVEPTNGRDFTGEDVKYNIERMRGEHPAGNQVGGEFRMADMFSPIETIDVQGNTVTLKTGEPFAPLMTNLSFTWVQMIPRELVEATGERNVLRWAVGTGPWILDGYDTLGDGGTIRYVKNPNYWKPGQPFFDTLEIPIVTARETLQSMFLNDQTDVSANIDAAVTLALRDSKPDIEIVEVPSFYVIKAYFDLTNNDSDWARDKRVRQAMYYFVPYQVFLQALGVECCRSGPVPPHQQPWPLPNEELPGWGLSPEEAIPEGLKLLDAAGYPSGTEIPLEFSVARFYGGDTIGELFVGLFGALKQQTNGALNINASVKFMELGEWFTNIYRGGSSYTASTHADWNYDDPDLTFFRYFHSSGTANNTHINSPELDRMLEAQRREMDEETRIDMIRDIQRFVLDEAPVIYMVAPNNFYAKQPWLENYRLMVLNNIEAPRHWDEIWYNEKAPPDRGVQ